MNTSPTTWSSLESSNEDALHIGQLSYFRERLRNRVHEAVLQRFLSESEKGLTRARIAKRLGKRPEQITRWLAAPGNWTIETVSDLLLAMNAELKVEVEDWAKYPRSNEAHPFICHALADEPVSAEIRNPVSTEAGKAEAMIWGNTNHLLNTISGGGSLREQLADEASADRRNTTSRLAQRREKRGAAALAYTD